MDTPEAIAVTNNSSTGPGINPPTRVYNPENIGVRTLSDDKDSLYISEKIADSFLAKIILDEAHIDQYDVIIGNPPFSQMSKWLLHSMKLSNKYICYIMPAHSLSYRRLKLFEELGWKLTNMHSFDNPKEWNIGFAHFFCIWEYVGEETDRMGVNDIIGRKEGVQKVLGEYI